MIVGVSDNDKCVNDTMTSVCMCRCVCVCVCHCSCSLSNWVQGTCLTHVTSIKVLSRILPHKSLFTNPTLLKSLSGDAEVAGTARCCLSIRTRWGNWILLQVPLPPHLSHNTSRVCTISCAFLHQDWPVYTFLLPVTVWFLGTCPIRVVHNNFVVKKKLKRDDPVSHTPTLHISKLQIRFQGLLHLGYFLLRYIYIPLLNQSIWQVTVRISSRRTQ